MHEHDQQAHELMELVFAFTQERMEMDPPPLDFSVPLEQLQADAGQTITAAGLGAHEVMRLFEEVLGPACLSIDHPRYLSFIPAAPTEAATLFDLIVSATSIYGGSWLEGSGAVYAENQTLRWLADLAGLPRTAGGTFVSGGSIANLSALAVARTVWRDADPARVDRRPVVLLSDAAHSSNASALALLDLRSLPVGVDDADRMTAATIGAAVDALTPDERGAICAVVATAGLTNSGTIDDLAAAADAAAELGAWLHVDAAYGGAALCSTTRRDRFAGIDRADSLTIDPHKWLFAPYDCAAILYRDPRLARRTFTQHASYLDVLTEAEDWSPSDYAPHLTRRARGLPTWFSLAVHGTDAYRDAVDTTIATTEAATALIRRLDHLELVVEPELSVIVFRRVGWSRPEYAAWSTRLLADQIGFVVPTSWRGETVLRLCITNPRTTLADVRACLPD
ncbi:pyridoxal phosphate-dependent decarboxylase family protein [Aquihabitans daechungensis]|uniref:pyridoxal phosphate-dependent decarboxylase family protein n=1 Tax=Aquihabitans daechungensis TaxID=1052257 RepID=UPI003BA2509C